MANGNEPTNRSLGIASEQHSRDIISIRDYFETILREYQSRTNERFEIQDKAVKTALEGQEKAVAAAIAAADRAVIKAEVATEKRFEGVNEFRGQLTDQANTFMPRTEAEIRLKTISDGLESLNRSVIRDEGHSTGVSTTVGQLIAGFAVFVATASLIAFIAFNLGHK